MQAETEHIYDEYEFEAVKAMWSRAAYHAKRLKKDDLFKRPSIDKQTITKSIEEQRKEVDEMNEWLATLTVERKG